MSADSVEHPPLVTRSGSLRVRMLLSAVLVLVLFLGVMGLVLDNANRQTAEQRVAERLQLHVYAFIAASEERLLDGRFSLRLPGYLQEPLFNRLGTGLFGLAFFDSSFEIWRSQSASDLMLTAAELETLLGGVEPGVPKFGQLPGTARRSALFYLTYPVIWQSGTADASFQFVVLEDIEPFNNEVRAFRTNLWGWLIGGILVLVIIQATILYWGLLPIGRLEKDLESIEQGRRQYLAGNYPREISGVTGHFNQLLAGERRQREQYRTTLADLAHSLKTPLAILKTEADSADRNGASTVSEQVDRMNEIVSYQLERAVSSYSSLISQQTDVAPVVEKLISALRRVYVDRQLSIESDIEDVVFAGDERDFMEMTGNLLDNACKYGRHRVLITATHDDGLSLVVEDDGDGIDESEREQVLRRGARLDTRESGQGIGLAVVAEIVARYQGQIEINRSKLGGARVSVKFAT